MSIMSPNDPGFQELAVQAFDVMMRRGWGAYKLLNGDWDVQDKEGAVCDENLSFGPDPFTALVEADKWYRSNIERESTNHGGTPCVP